MDDRISFFFYVRGDVKTCAMRDAPCAEPDRCNRGLRDVIRIGKSSSNGGWVVPTSVWRVMSFGGFAHKVISPNGSVS